MKYICEEKSHSAEMGRSGRSLIEKINWPEVVEKLLNASFDENIGETGQQTRLRATVLDMQPIEPPVGGGRLRLLGLYHNLHELFQTEYIGSYDWPGEKWRRLAHSETLSETTVPLSTEHFKAAAKLSRKTNNKTVIDLAFPQLGHLSEEYLDTAIDHVIRSDIVVFSHPWVFPLVSRYLRPDQLIVYDSQNVEGYLRAQLLDRQEPSEYALLSEVVNAEYSLLRRADIVLACSQEDIELFVSIFEIDPGKFRLVPNGVMASSITPVAHSKKAELKSVMGIGKDRICAVFIGSSYGPNLEAARFIIDDLAQKYSEIQFVIGGGVGDAIHTEVPANVLVTGQLSEEDKVKWLGAADIAINPMFSGSGTNIKMFDFLAAGLPTLATPIGARGIPMVNPPPYIKAEPDSFADQLKKLVGNEVARDALKLDSRRFVEQYFSWERISSRTGKLLEMAFRKMGSEPYFSVIIPTFERAEELSRLLSALEKQTMTEFEVIIVDQSKDASDASGYDLNIEYCHTDVRGAIHARNYGASLATAEYLAFIDDDCIPDVTWLENARHEFEASSESIVGIEGEIICPESDRSKYRVVTNVGTIGLYMTANLFVQASAFRLTGGFDIIFDNPHFREDTDLGWRLEDLGGLLRSNRVRVTHLRLQKAV